MLWFIAISALICLGIPIANLVFEALHWRRFARVYGLSRDILGAGHELRYRFETEHRVNLPIAIRERLMHAIAAIDARTPGFAARVRWMDTPPSEAWASVERTPGMREALRPYRSVKPVTERHSTTLVSG